MRTSILSGGTGNGQQSNGTPNVPEYTSGAAHTLTQNGLTTNAGNVTIANLLGGSLDLVAISGATVTYADLSQFSSTDIRLVLITDDAAAVTWTVGVEYYYDDNTEVHAVSATLINGVTVSTSVALPKYDKYVKVTITPSGAGETCWCYIVGRENS